ncbi:MAG TPA: ATP-binding protein [Burkholderiaceae bacterium]
MKLKALPASPDALRLQVMWRVLRLGGALLGVTLVGYALAYTLAGRWVLAAVEAAGLVALAVVYLTASRRDAPEWGVCGVAIVTWLALAVVIVLQGGLTAPALAWLLAVSPLAIVAGLSIALPITGATLLFVVGLYTAEVAGWLPAAVSVGSPQRAVSACLIVLLFAVFATYSQRWRELMAAELAAARDEAIRHNALKDQFITHLNHEIRTPLNALTTAAEVLAKQDMTRVQRTLVDAQLGAARHLLGLINNVLDHSRLSTAGVLLESQPLSVPEVVTQVVTMFRPAAADKGIVLTMLGGERETGTRLGDATRLRQILANLTSNAVKFTARGHVHIEIGNGGTVDDDSVVIRVRDSGEGMDEVALKRLFQPYVQLDASVPRRHGGSGLGLAICRELTTLMGGTIDVDSTPAAGTCFTLRLPMPRAPAEPAGDATQDATQRQRRLVLLVEDDPTNRIIVAAALEHLGAAVDVAESGSAALDLLSQRSYDLVLMDRRMPGIDGLEAMRRWRADEQLRGDAGVPIIALTGDADPLSRTELLQAGADDVLIKPASIERLSHLLGAAASLRQQRKAARFAVNAPV